VDKVYIALKYFRDRITVLPQINGAAKCIEDVLHKIVSTFRLIIHS
jgi:hypothetical protein